MPTLYLRNVPAPVLSRLRQLADGAGMSLSAYVGRELAEIARRADNPALLAELPDLPVAARDVVADVERSRAAR